MSRIESPFYQILYEKKWIGILFPLILFLLFYTLNEGASKPEGLFLFAFKVAVFSIVIFIVNFKVLTPIFLEQNKWILYIVSILSMLGLIHLLEIYIPQLFLPLWVYDTDLTTMVWYFMVVGVSAQYKTLSLWQNNKIETTQNEQAKLKMELDFLKSQFNPHFLFNTLNNIYALVNKNDYRAAPMLSTLSNLLRYSLYEGGQNQVRLVKEVEFLENYIELQLLRDIKSHNIDFYIEGVNSRQVIAPMILVNYVENAFKHSNVFTDETAWMKVEIIVEDELLHFSVKNSCIPINNVDVTDGGIGMLNAKKQIELNYFDAFSLDISNKKNSFEVNLEIKLNKHL